MKPELKLKPEVETTTSSLPPNLKPFKQKLLSGKKSYSTEMSAEVLKSTDDTTFDSSVKKNDYLKRCHRKRAQ